jgi:homoserine O-acetyltransferase
MSEPAEILTFDAGDVKLQSGAVLPKAKITYTTYGILNSAKDNLIIYPTSFGARHLETEWLVKPDAILDPDRYFVVIPNLFANGLSTSPSNWVGRGGTAVFPNVTYFDAVDVQHRLLVEEFGISKVALVYGFSMGAMQAYHWAVRFPEMVDRVAVVCGSARCSPYNRVFLDGVRAALQADPAYRDGKFLEKPIRGLKAMGRVYAGWALSHAFYRDEAWRGLGYSSLDDFLERSWDTAFSNQDANNLLAQIWMWQNGDISQCEAYGGNFASALGAIRARMLLLPGATDRYFPPDDNAAELPLLKNARSAELCPIPSIFGHRAGNPVALPDDRAFLRQKIDALLRS